MTRNPPPDWPEVGFHTYDHPTISDPEGNTMPALLDSDDPIIRAATIAPNGEEVVAIGQLPAHKRHEQVHRTLTDQLRAEIDGH